VFFFHDNPCRVAEFFTGFHRIPDWLFMAANRQCLDNGVIGTRRKNFRREKKNRAAMTPPDSRARIKEIRAY